MVPANTLYLALTLYKRAMDTSLFKKAIAQKPRAHWVLYTLLMAGCRELESLTFAVTVRCSNQTELTPHDAWLLELTGFALL